MTTRKQLVNPASNSELRPYVVHLNKVVEYVDNWCQTSLFDEDPIRGSCDKIYTSVTPIYKPKSRRKQTPIKAISKLDEVEKDDTDIWCDKNSMQNGLGETAVEDVCCRNISFHQDNFKSDLDSLSENLTSRKVKLKRISDDINVPSVSSPERTINSIQTASLEKDRFHGRFKCLLCPFANNHKAALVLHSVVHEGKLPYRCKSCPFSSQDSALFDAHIKHHTGEQKFVCTKPGCEYSTNNSSNMKRHQRSHKGAVIASSDNFSGENFENMKGLSSNSKDWLNDDVCWQRFSTARKHTCTGQEVEGADFVFTKRLTDFTSKVQESQKHSILKCDLCDYQTNIVSNLRRHRVKHREQSVHSCPQCLYRTNYLGNMRRHFEVRHRVPATMNRDLSGSSNDSVDLQHNEEMSSTDKKSTEVKTALKEVHEFEYDGIGKKLNAKKPVNTVSDSSIGFLQKMVYFKQ